MGNPYKYDSSWKTEDLFTDYYTQDEVAVLISASYKIVPVYSSAPASPLDGWMYVNSGDDKIYIYYGGTWQALHTLTPAVPPVITDGVPMGLLLALTYQT